MNLTKPQKQINHNFQIHLNFEIKISIYDRIILSWAWVLKAFLLKGFGTLHHHESSVGFNQKMQNLVEYSTSSKREQNLE